MGGDTGVHQYKRRHAVGRPFPAFYARLLLPLIMLLRGNQWRSELHRASVGEHGTTLRCKSGFTDMLDFVFFVDC